MAGTEATCMRLQQLGIRCAEDAQNIALRVKQQMAKLPLCGEGGGDEEAQMLARWRYNAAVRGEIQNYRARCQSPPPPSLTGDDEEFFRAQQYAKHLPTCPDCDGVDLAQVDEGHIMRSADEGPTIHMKCKTCNKIVRPVYNMKE